MFLLSLVEFIKKENVIIGFIMMVVGLVLVMLAKKITIAVKSNKEIKEDDTLMSVLKIIGLIMLLVSLVLIVLP